jgi:hypothetical protein
MRNIMNTTLTNETRHDPSVHEHSALENRLPAVRRVGLADRAALHLGVALIKWGRRPGTPGRERRVNRVERALLNRDRQFALASLASEGTTIDYTSQLAPLR